MPSAASLPASPWEWQTAWPVVTFKENATIYKEDAPLILGSWVTWGKKTKLNNENRKGITKLELMKEIEEKLNK